MITPKALPARLKELRTGRHVSQGRVAKGLGVSTPTISSWENERKPGRVQEQYLEMYARLFCTPRSFVDGTRLLGLDELDDGERALYGVLKAELCGPSEVRDPLRFDPGEDVTIICAPLPEKMRNAMPYVDRLDPDHVAMYTYADLDALYELIGYVRQVNPTNRFELRLASVVQEAALYTHLILLGGVDWNEMTRHLLDQLPIPVSQQARVDGAGAFVVDGGQSYEPVLRREAERNVLREDVALFCRAPNPYNRDRTVTMFNGMYGRGTHGIVRALTDVRFRDSNAGYIEERFTGKKQYSVLSRVEFPGGLVATPDWRIAGTVLHEWSA